MKKIILLFALLFSFGTYSHLQEIMQDSIYFYNPDGSKNWWYVQNDVFSFRMTDGDAFTSSYQADKINSIQHLPYSTCKENELHFSPDVDLGTRWEIMNNQFRQSPDVEWAIVAITSDRSSQNDYTQNNYHLLNDFVLVNFIDADISVEDVDDFMQRNGLTLYHKPSETLPIANWTYVFRISDRYESTFEAARTIFNAEQEVITRCIPDIEGLFEPSGCEPVDEMSEFENTNAKDALWHIKNRGLAPVGGFGNGTAGADSKICECWGEGFHGEGIKVAVIDFGGFDYTHPDMQGQFLEGYDLINNGVPYNSSFWDAANPQQHGMAVSGVIAAKANEGYIRSAVGTAYNSKIIPMLTSGSTSQISIGIQKAVEKGVDIINMSFGYTTSSFGTGESYLYQDIKDANLYGRNGLGTIVIASTGNDDSNQIYNWPAVDDVTIGVGASDPNDYRGSSSQNYNSWSWTGGSNYSNGNQLYKRYHLVAPGTLIYTSTTQNPLTNPNQVSGAWTGTSFSTPLTSGVVAILLSKNQGLNIGEIENALTSNADKVRQDRYNHNLYQDAPGFNEEMFEGRLNCIKSLNDITLSLEELSYSQQQVINMAYYNENEFGLFFNNDLSNSQYIIEVYNLSGQKISTHKSTPNVYDITINTMGYANGIYLVNVRDTKGQFVQTLKYVK